uniref:Transmembrane protein n=1 Tax=Hemiselmis tepida TaxID=464990 RepID=A0A7S0V688_9CRYP
MAYASLPSQEAVAPHSSTYGTALSATRSRQTRAVTLLGTCMGAAALVALAGGLQRGGEQQPQQSELAVSGLKLIPDFMHSQHERTTSDLAASAHSLMDTASGIMQDARSHALAGDLTLPSGLKLATVQSQGGAEQGGGILGTIADDAAKLAPRQAPRFFQGEELAGSGGNATATPAAGGGNATDSAGPAPAAATGEADSAGGKKKILGAAGEEVFGGSNSSFVGFLGFSKKEPSFLGIPFPILMFLGVVCACASCITVGCLVARNTSVLKVNVAKADKGEDDDEEEEEDEKGYYWREQNKD